MSLKSALYVTAAMAALASQGYGSAFGGSVSPRGIGRDAKRKLTPEQKKVRKANKKAGKSRAKNRRK